MSDDRLIGVRAEGAMPDGSVSFFGITFRYRDKEFIGPMVEEQVREALERSHPGVVHTGTYWGQPYVLPELEEDE